MTPLDTTALEGPQRTVLAFDPATTTGWALLGAEPDGRVVYLGGGSRTFAWRDDCLGELWCDVDTWFLQLLGQVGPMTTLIAYEQVRAHRGTIAAHRYGGLLATLLRLAQRRRALVLPIPVATAKKRLLGKGGGEGTGKPEMVAGVEALGLDVVDDNHADAVAVGLAALDLSATLRTTPETT